jgi:hypothetical protein
MGSNGWMKTLGLAGAALAAWYFLDPSKGAERRNKIAREARDIYDTTKDELGRVSKDLADGVGSTVKSVSETVGGLLHHQNGGGHAAVDGTSGGSAGRTATSGV